MLLTSNIEEIVDYTNDLENAQGKQDRELIQQVLDDLVDYTMSHLLSKKICKRKPVTDTANHTKKCMNYSSGA
jgi:hypothetical protein